MTQMLTEKGTVLDRLTRALMAGTCLTLASAVPASADMIIKEGTSPAPSDFGNSIDAVYVLAAGVTEVDGAVTGAGGSDSEDWFEFTNLLPGSNFSVYFQT